jgi:CRP/FNR family transcriptional regulator, cyclic AMP receptor protein
MIRLMNKIETATNSDLSMNWLKPFMTKRMCEAGDVLFWKGDIATELYFTLVGKFQLEDVRIAIPPGEIVGEIAFVAPEAHRTQTFECLEDGELLTIGYLQIRQLLFQNPTFGFYLLPLICGRLFKDIENLEMALAKAKAGTSARRAG